MPVHDNDDNNNKHLVGETLHLEEENKYIYI